AGALPRARATPRNRSGACPSGCKAEAPGWQPASTGTADTSRAVDSAGMASTGVELRREAWIVLPRYGARVSAARYEPMGLQPSLGCIRGHDGSCRARRLDEALCGDTRSRGAQE